MVTRNDVARVAGVSTAVVSYVLNDGPRPVSATARQKVLAAIDELGYRRNSIARFMRTRSTNSIGFVLPQITLSYFSTMTQRVTEIAHARGLSVIVATSNGDLEVEREHLTDLAGRQVNGVILMSVDPAQDLSWAASLGTPVLIVDRPTVAIEATAAAVDHLVKQGCRQLARITGPADDIITRRRDEGWHRAIGRHRLDPYAAPTIRAAMTAADGLNAAHSLLDRADRPDGVVIDAPMHAAAFLRSAADLRVLVPDDVAVVGMEYGGAAEYAVPRLTSVDSPLDVIAERAVEAIADASSEDGLLSLDSVGFTLTERESSARRGAEATP